MNGHVMVVRLDSMGDLLACGPAIRAVAANSQRLTLLVGPLGAAAAELLPGVDDVVVWNCPWIVNPPPAVDATEIAAIVARIAGLEVAEAIILTSFHQSALPTALLLRMAGVPLISAISEDYPGSLLDRRLAPPGDKPEPLRMLDLVAGAGYELPADDDGRLAVRQPLPDLPQGLGPRYLVVHPGTSAPARAYPASMWALAVAELTAAGWSVAVTGSVAEKALTAEVAAGAGSGSVVDLGGALSLWELAAVLSHAEVVVVGNTGPAHLAAAVGTPIVSLFAPVVSAIRWAPYGVPTVLLGDQQAGCRDTRATVCPIQGHPCLTSVSGKTIARAVHQLWRRQSMALVR